MTEKINIKIKRLICKIFGHRLVDGINLKEWSVVGKEYISYCSRCKEIL